MKKIQLLIAVPSAILLFLSLFLNYKTGLFISMGGVFVSFIIRQIRLQKYSYMLGHPDRHFGRFSNDNSIDPLEQAETYEIDFERERDRNK
ncbi:hypothetical protein [Oceanobacillus salinisoli]|uniref:hypothetical protein n=1 Tax=Oceanobacillus salinisoli TaxID=2678611 RepID=UPI0012E2A812|nr:hypothetical protein [Oceanobacillus salinisoli]